MADKPLPAATPKPLAPRPVPKGAEPSGGIQAVRGAKATGVREELEELEQSGAFNVWLRESLKNTPAWMVSMVFHMIVLLGLALWMLPMPDLDALRQLVIAPGENEEFDELEELEDEPLEELDVETVAELVSVESPVEHEEMEISPADDMDAAAVQVELSEFGLELALAPGAHKPALLLTVLENDEGWDAHDRVCRHGRWVLVNVEFCDVEFARVFAR